MAITLSQDGVWDFNPDSGIIRYSSTKKGPRLNVRKSNIGTLEFHRVLMFVNVYSIIYGH